MRPRAVRAGAMLLPLTALYPAAFAGHFAGDAEVHLVYAAGAAQGRFFEFNPGEKAPGVTSVGYMLMLAAIHLALPEGAVPLAVKVANYAAWYATLAVVHRLARRLLGTPGHALAAAVVTGLLPGAVYNAVVGMESGLFALVVAGFLLHAVSTGWFEGAASARAEALAAALLAAAVWLRPEGTLVALIGYGVRAAGAAGRPGREWRALAASVAAVAAAGALLLGFHHSQTGWWLPGSGLARVYLGQQASVVLGPVSVNTAVIRRLALYAPLTVAALVGTGRAWRAARHAGAWRTVALVAWAFPLLYSSVLGAANLGRYLVFVMPLLVLLALFGVQAVAGSGRPVRRWRPAAAVLAAAWLGAVVIAETVVRFGLGSPGALLAAMDSPGRRREASQALLAALGDPAGRPVVIALVEVQIRRRLDDRFVVRSLDGRVDPELLRFYRDGIYDHLGYLRARRVQFLLEAPDLNRDRRAWSLARLAALGPGEAVVRDGLRITRLPAPVYRVEPAL